MKVTIVSPYALPERGANSFRVHSLGDFLKRNNVETEIFSPERNVPETDIVKRYSGIFDLMKKVLKSKSNIVIYTSPPITHAIFAGFAAKLSGKKFFLDIRDPWPKVSEVLGIYKKNSPKLLLYKLIEQISYLLAEKIFVVTEGIKKHVEQKGAGPKIVLAPNGTLPDFKFLPKEREKIRNKIGLSKNNLLFVYSGSFVGWDTKKIVEAFVHYPKNTKLLLLLPTPEESKKDYLLLRAFAEKTLKERVLVLDIKGFLPRQITAYFSAADVGIITVPDGLNYCIRAKTYDYLASGLYLLAKGPSNGSLKNLFKKYDVGTYFESWNSFKNFGEQKAKFSYSQRCIRERIAKKNFLREQTNEIIFKEIS